MFVLSIQVGAPIPIISYFGETPAFVVQVATMLRC